MRPVVTGAAWSVCMSVSCLLDTTASCAETDELIKMPFGLSTDVLQSDEKKFAVHKLVW